MTSNFIFSEAKRVRKRCDTADPFAALEAMGVVVVHSDRYAKDGLKGFCAILNRIMYVVINAKLSSEEQRVVAAHELGHLVLHRKELLVGACTDASIYDATGQQERDATLFAAEFLLGDAELQEAMQNYDADIYSMASALYLPVPLLAFKVFGMQARGYVDLRLPVDLNSQFLAG